MIHELRPVVLGLFQKRIEGDDALMELARLRFEELGLGIELYADDAEDALHTLNYRPSAECCAEGYAVLHLPRGLDITEQEGRERIITFATKLAGRIDAMVLHDHRACRLDFDLYTQSLRRLAAEIEDIKHAPLLHVEYASGLPFDLFTSLFEQLRDVQVLSACIDIGHVGLKFAREHYRLIQKDANIYRLTPESAHLPEVIERMQEAVQHALPAVLAMIREINRHGKPLHFHLHDAHPLYRTNPFGLSDHMSFLERVEIPFVHAGLRSLPSMFGISGLRDVVTTALDHTSCDKVSFTLEIHPAEGLLPLHSSEEMFTHWTDKTNAMRMNHWMSILRQNALLVQDIIAQHTIIKTGSTHNA